MTTNSSITSVLDSAILDRVQTTRLGDFGQETYYKLLGIRWATLFGALWCALVNLHRAVKARDPFTVIFAAHNLLWTAFELTRKSLLLFNTTLGYTGMAFVHALGNFAHLTVSVGLFVTFFLYCFIGPAGFHKKNSDMACHTVLGACIGVLISVVTFHIVVDYRQMVETHANGLIDQAELGSAHGSVRLKVIISATAILACFVVWLAAKFLRAKLPKQPKVLHALVMAVPVIEVLWLGQHLLSVAISAVAAAADKAEVLEGAVEMLLVGYTRWMVYEMLKRKAMAPATPGDDTKPQLLIMQTEVDKPHPHLLMMEAQPLQSVKTVA